MPPVKRRTAQPITHTFADDGRIPNNVLPLVLYRCAIDLTGSPDPEDLIEKTLPTTAGAACGATASFPTCTIIL